MESHSMHDPLKREVLPSNELILRVWSEQRFMARCSTR